MYQTTAIHIAKRKMKRKDEVIISVAIIIVVLGAVYAYFRYFGRQSLMRRRPLLMITV
jgi:uncharacterized membrane protein YidH (DUF202 family)